MASYGSASNDGYDFDTTVVETTHFVPKTCEDQSPAEFLTPFGWVTPREGGGSYVTGLRLDVMPDYLSSRISDTLRNIGGKRPSNESVVKGVLESLWHFFKLLKLLINNSPIQFSSK